VGDFLALINVDNEDAPVSDHHAHQRLHRFLATSRMKGESTPNYFSQSDNKYGQKAQEETQRGARAYRHERRPSHAEGGSILQKTPSISRSLRATSWATALGRNRLLFILHEYQCKSILSKVL